MCLFPNLIVISISRYGLHCTEGGLHCTEGGLYTTSFTTSYKYVTVHSGLVQCLLNQDVFAIFPSGHWQCADANRHQVLPGVWWRESRL